MNLVIIFIMIFYWQYICGDSSSECSDKTDSTWCTSNIIQCTNPESSSTMSKNCIKTCKFCSQQDISSIPLLFKLSSTTYQSNGLKLSLSVMNSFLSTSSHSTTSNLALLSKNLFTNGLIDDHKDSSTTASSFWSTTASPSLSSSSATISSTTASPISSTTASLGLYLHPVTFSSATVSPGLSSYSATISSTTTISVSPTTARPGLSSPTATFSSTTASLGLSSSHATFLSTTASPEWSIWSECSTTCGNGYRTRRSFGVMNYGTETKSCKIIYCPVDGMWGDWSKSECSTSCGGWGKIYFNRSCNYPSPMYYGQVCMGLNNYTDDCLDDRTCPVNGIWSEWSVWSLCNKPCERGVMSRFRTCSNPKYGGQYCNGSSIQTTYCPLQLCNKMSLIVNIYLPEDPYQPYYSTLDHPGSVVLKNNIETAIANLYKKLKTNATFNIELNTITDGDP